MKKNVLVIIISVLFVISVFSIKPLLTISSKCFWSFVTNYLDDAEQKRQSRIENGEIIRGKDTILIWENKYAIGHYPNSNHLEIYINGLPKSILEKITKYKVVKKKLYIISDEGFAVIDKNNICRVFVTVSDDEFVSGFSVDEQGNKHYNSRYVKDENIQYLSAFDEYPTYEQKIFYKLKK
jgi:hypothetical protein